MLRSLEENKNVPNGDLLALLAVVCPFFFEEIMAFCVGNVNKTRIKNNSVY